MAYSILCKNLKIFRRGVQRCLLFWTWTDPCGKAASAGLRYPLALISMNGLALDFFTTYPFLPYPCNINKQQQIKIVKLCMLYFTISPANDLIFTIVWYPLGPNSAPPYTDNIQSEKFILRLIYEHPVSAALHFERFSSDWLQGMFPLFSCFP